MALHGVRRPFAIVLMAGVTIVAAGPSITNPVQRFLAVDNACGHTLLTVVTDPSTAVSALGPLRSGIRVRVYGRRQGRTIRAQRIEPMD